MPDQLTRTLAERHRDALGAGAPMFYREPVELVRGDGVWLYGADGRRYLDGYNNVPCVGHANPRVAAAMADQAATLNVHSRYMHEGVVEYAERVAGLHHDGLTTTVFTCTGSEAIEVALMTARAATGRHGIVVTEATYHGNTAEVSKTAGIADKVRAGGAVPDGYAAVPVPDAADGTSDPTEYHLSRLREAIDSLANSEHGFAGVLMCSLLANEGLPDIPAGYFRRAVEMVHEAGGVFIADEVQAGFGRAGRWWGYELSGFAPDIAVMGKPMGGGLPLSGTTASAELIDRFRAARRYFNTFASSPLQAAVGMAVIDEIEDRGLVDQVADVGAYLLEGIRAIEGKPAAMGPVRGAGLFVGIDWLDADGRPDPAGAADVVDAMKERGVLIGRSGAHNNCVKIRPPLVFEREHADLVIATFAEVVASHA